MFDFDSDGIVHYHLKFFTDLCATVIYLYIQKN
jgi:hypothetical protein